MNIIKKIVYFFVYLLSLILILSGCSGKTECPSCKGEGFVVCSSCGGDKIADSQEDCRSCRNGKILCQECDGEGSGQCKLCKGSGLQMNPCFVCGGSGLHFYPSGHSVPCNVCGGVGIKHLPCNKCNSTGHFECEACSGKGYFSCKECNGKGIIITTAKCDKCEDGKEKCLTCNGQGFIIK